MQYDLTSYKAIIIFRGGQGGNFLASLFTEQKDHIERLDTNEYLCTSSDIGEYHINLWFKTVENPEYGNEIYTKYRYRQMLEQLSTVPKIVVVNNPTHIHETELLGDAKSHAVLFTPTIRQAKKMFDRWNRHLEKIVAHYDYFEKILRKYNSNVYHLDYQDFFIKQNCKPLFDFMESEDKTHLVKEYHDNNEKILNRHGFTFN